MSGLLNSTGAVSGILGTITAPAVGTGIDGYVLTATGAGVNPAWEAAGAGSVSANDVVAFKSINWDADATIAYTGTAFAEISSNIRIVHAMSDADNKLVFFFQFN